MSRFLSWVCPCCFLGPSYAPLQSDEQHGQYDSSRPNVATAVELADAAELHVDSQAHPTTDEEQPIYTIDEDAQLVPITRLPVRTARTVTAAVSRLATSNEGERGRPPLSQLILDSASASQSSSAAASPLVSPSPSRWAEAARHRLASPSRSSNLSPSVSATSSATAAAASAAAYTATESVLASSSLSQSPSTAAARSLFSFSSASLTSFSSASSPSHLRLLLPLSLSPNDSSQLVTPAAAATAHPVQHDLAAHVNAVAEPSSGQHLLGASTAYERRGRSWKHDRQKKEPSMEQATQHRASKGGDEQQGQEVEQEDEREVRLAKDVASPVIRIPSPRHRQQSIISRSPVLTGSSTQSNDSSLSTISISPSVAPTSPGVSSAPGSPCSALLLSSSFSSVASGMSSLAPSTSPRSPFTSSQLSTSQLTPLQLDSHLPDTPSTSSVPSLLVPERRAVKQAADASGGGKLPTLSPPHEISHRRLSSAAVPITTAAAAPPPSSIRTNPPSPEKGSTPTNRPVPAIPAALPTAAVMPAVHFKRGENPLLTLAIPKGELSVEHISSIIDLFSPPLSSSPSPASLLSTLASHLTYLHLFNFVISAPRTVSSAVFKHFSQPILARHRPPNPRPSPNAQIGLLLLQFLTDHVVSVSTSTSGLTFSFAFPRHSDSFTLDVPTPDMFVLESRHPTDPTLVHPLNVVRKADNEVRRIVFSRVVRVLLGKDRGIVGLGSGDLSVKKVFSFSCDMRYERRIGEVDVDSSGRQVVEDREGKVRVESGHYVLARYDDWLIVTVLGQQVLIGLPRFTRVNE